MKQINFFKQLLLLFIIILLPNFSIAQTPQLWVEGEVSTVTIENESFENGLGGFTNSGIVNFSTTNTSSSEGTYSAYSGYLSNNNYAVLSRTINVPTNYTAKLTFDHYALLSGYLDGEVAMVFSNNTAILAQLFYTTNWTEVEVYLPAGTNTIVWECYTYSSSHILNYYLDNVQITYVENTAIKLQDGNEGEGKVLSSDYQGNATWKNIGELKSGLTDPDYLVPLIIDGNNNNEYQNLAEIKNGDNIGLLINNNSTGISLDDNSNGIRINDSYYGINISNSGSYGIRVSGNNGTYYNTGGIIAFSNNGQGIVSSSNDGIGFYSYWNSGEAANLSGDVTVTGNLSKSAGSFKIDHPVDPENKFLYHSFVESPDMMNIYNGNVQLDENGTATVTLEDWFEPLNRDFRYQLTSIGAPSPNLYIAQQVENQAFKIAGGEPNALVSWQLTGIRQDKYAEANRIEVEVDKEEKFKGYYLHPEIYGYGFEKGFDYVMNGYKSLEELKAGPKMDEKRTRKPAKHIEIKE